jgi:hypothetical protein
VSSPRLSYSFFPEDCHQGAKACGSDSETFPFFEAQPRIVTDAKATKVKVIEYVGPTIVNKAIVRFIGFKLIIEFVVKN